jgi:hypothetical protein
MSIINHFHCYFLRSVGNLIQALVKVSHMATEPPVDLAIEQVQRTGLGQSRTLN